MTNQTPLTQQPDDDLLERFVLGRVTEAERAKVESMLTRSHEWREALRREELIAAGARRLGRDQLRDRLSRRVGTHAWFSSPWVRYSAMAASVMLVIGVALYSFLPAPRVQEESPPIARSGKVTAPEPKSSPESGIAGKPDADRDLRSAEGRGMEEAAQTPTHAAKTDARERTDLPSEKIDKPAAVYKATDKGTQATEFWTDGIPVAAEQTLAAGKDEAEAKNETDRMQQQGRTKGERSAGTQAQAPSPGKQYERKLIVLQRPLQDAGARRQAFAAGSREGHIPTFVRLAGDTLSMTLYLDHQLDPSLLESATVESAGGDSLVIVVGSQRIGYNLQRKSAGITPQK